MSGPAREWSVIAILGAVVCEHLYRRFPCDLEGELTKIKSNAVSRRVCSELSVELGLSDAVQLGKGMGDRATLPQSLLAALFESVIGAIYLDGGFAACREVVLSALAPRLADLHKRREIESVLEDLEQALTQLRSTLKANN